jgi:hypothetical protein
MTDEEKRAFTIKLALAAAIALMFVGTLVTMDYYALMDVLEKTR